MASYRTALDIILERLAPLAGKRILDVGCGRGKLAAPLQEAGAHWTGVDPFPPPEPLTVPVQRASAKAFPFPDEMFDAVLFVNALHHVPVADMPAALLEAGRVVVRGDGDVLVIEPKPEGPLSRVLAVIDDETEIRKAAQRAIANATSLHLERSFCYQRRDQYLNYEDFLAHIVQVDPRRLEAVQEHGADLRAAFETYAQIEDGTLGLEQPMRVHHLRTSLKMA